MNLRRRQFLAAATAATATAVSGRAVYGQQREGRRLVEPLYRVAKANNLPTKDAGHPLDSALRLAEKGLEHIRANVDDYTATIVKRERMGGTVGDYEYMFAKIRNRKVRDGRVEVPFSVYLTFLKPASVKGREVVFVENRNDGKIVAHEGGFKGRFLPTVSLQPTSTLAMRGNRYPITELGVENLIVQLIERGQRDRQHDDVQVEFRRNAKINGRTCTLLIVTHPERRPEFDFHIAQIFLDDELNIPIRYVAYDWPSRDGAEPEVIEEYTYLNLKVNVGLTDDDFDPKNPDYNFYSG